MKRLVILGMAICVASILLPACAPAPEPEPEPEPVVDLQAEEAAIRALPEQAATAMNNHDAKAIATLVVEDYETWNGEVKGIADYEQYYVDFFETQKDVQYEILEEIGLIFLTPDVAIYKARGKFSNQVDDEGKTTPPQQYLHAWVVVKQNGEWRVAALFSSPEETPDTSET
jgi:uncharacterized protein (TIGR02246 family)